LKPKEWNAKIAIIVNTSKYTPKYVKNPLEWYRKISESIRVVSRYRDIILVVKVVNLSRKKIEKNSREKVN